ncbi:uncharacterized protein DUF4392 [Sinobacterium caligoides]|uniref:Uncharacterized protein DUF4392 n=1 Tax=Sinobacterium caligoides TaxID=933926 RepID=A0A3N2DXS2_9GAMM|nr:glutamate cyclase domain-containing protein [Sinobacterium caligoides]ROS04587.1 uncharacterized protein DUF4392 [Sinobacterium caligoides]
MSSLEVELTISEQSLSQQVEDLLVKRNLRGMKEMQASLRPGYYGRAAKLINRVKGTVLIGTGFPVLDTFETDGPVGAIALYDVLKHLGARPVIVCGDPLASALSADYCVHTINTNAIATRVEEAKQSLALLSPELVISIERPGLSKGAGYFNMRGEDISARCASFDEFLNQAECPTIAVGDGGNEIGMGNIYTTVKQLDIVPTVTGCDELLISDVSNWGAHGLIALLSVANDEDLFQLVRPITILRYLSNRGSVDGVTRENTLTEDGLPVSAGDELIEQLRQLTGFSIK